MIEKERKRESEKESVDEIFVLCDPGWFGASGSEYENGKVS